LLWKFQLLNIDVSFYKQTRNEIAYQKARAKYQNESAGILGEIRAQISTSRRLASPRMQERLTKLYFETLLREDSNLEQLIKKGTAALFEEWDSQHKASFYAAQKEIDDVLTELATEFKLSAPISGGKGT
jgi:hypothetical protein